MTLVAIVLVYRGADVAIAQRSIAGRPWLARLVDRLGTARSVARVVVMCEESREELVALLDHTAAEVIDTRDPIGSARALGGDHGGVAFCPVGQLFADPLRLDALVEHGLEAAAGRAHAVLEDDPSLSLSGGAFLDVLTRRGLEAVGAGADLASLPAARWPTRPEAPEMRIDATADADWAVSACEALLARDPSGGLAGFEAMLRETKLARSALWDRIGPAPRTILMLRCVRAPLFETIVGHVARVPGTRIDVVCSHTLADHTSRLAGVAGVIPFEGEVFGLEALAPSTLETIRAREYDLCVLPRREPTGRGLENTWPLALASGARTGMWIDVFGRAGLLSGRRQGWDPAIWSIESDAAPGHGPHAQSLARAWCPPHEHAAHYERRATVALDRYTTTFELPAELLTMVDENLVCRGLLDNAGLGLDRESGLLFQRRASVEIGRHLAHLASSRPEWSGTLTTAVDAIYRHLVGVEAPRPIGASEGAVPVQADEVLEPLAAALGRLAEEASAHRAPPSASGTPAVGRG